MTWYEIAGIVACTAGLVLYGCYRLTCRLIARTFKDLASWW